MSLTLWLTFMVAAVLISVSPGAGAVNTMSNGLRYGVKQSMPAILGLQLGYGAQIVLVGAGLGALVASSVWALAIIKWLGGCLPDLVGDPEMAGASGCECGRR